MADSDQNHGLRRRKPFSRLAMAAVLVGVAAAIATGDAAERSEALPANSSQYEDGWTVPGTSSLSGRGMERAPGPAVLWDTATQEVTVNVEGWDLHRVLRHVSFATGWQILVEPGLDRPVSARFQRVRPREALRMLLGDLNFALIPQNGHDHDLLIYRTSPRAATELLGEPSERGQPIPNELIVTLTPDSGIDIETLADRLGGKVVGRINGVGSFRLQFADKESADAARQLLQDHPGIGALDSNYALEVPEQLANTAFGHPLRFSIRPKPSPRTEQVVIGMLDTAVQPLRSEMQSFLLPTIHVAGEPGGLPEGITHGTSMAQTILHGLAANHSASDGSPVRILPVDIYGPNRGTTTFEIAGGIQAAIGAGARIINLSLGGEGDSPFLNRLIQQAHRDGIVFFGSAGNLPTSAPTFPAAYPEVVAVTAGDRYGNIAPYANRGEFVDVIAPGLSLVDFGGATYYVQGTSAATAYVSGVAASYATTGKSTEEVEGAIRSHLALQPQPPQP